MIYCRHYAIVGTGWPPIEPRLSINPFVYDPVREHGLALNPEYESSELIEFLRLAVLPHGFHLTVDIPHGVSQLF